MCFFLKILWFFWTLQVLLQHWFSTCLVCVHTLTRRETRVRNILNNSEKTQYLMNTLYLSIYVGTASPWPRTPGPPSPSSTRTDAPSTRQSFPGFYKKKLFKILQSINIKCKVILSYLSCLEYFLPIIHCYKFVCLV